MKFLKNAEKYTYEVTNHNNEVRIVRMCEFCGGTRRATEFGIGMYFSFICNYAP